MSDAGLRAIFVSERPMLLRLLSVRLGSKEEAEDALHDLWLKLEATAGGPIAEPASYIFRMANNLALDRRRAAARRTGRETSWAQTQPGPLEQPDVERELLARERLARIDSSLSMLPERVATAFRLYRFEELPRKSIAEHMGISVSAVEKLLQRAYRTIYRSAENYTVELPTSRRLNRMGARDDG